MNFIIVGTNHKYSSLTLREGLSFPKRRLQDALNILKERRVLTRAIILSTCNRVEVYACVEDVRAGRREIENFISGFQEIGREKFYPCLYQYEGREAISHLYAVVCGLDSLILGETEILCQVKYAFEESGRVGFTDAWLRRIFRSAISFAGKVHSETKISEGKVSVGSVTIDFIKEKIGSITGKKILIVGVGKVTSLILRYLQEENPRIIFVANRTFEKAQGLACSIEAQVVKFNELSEVLKKADVLITATASPHFIITQKILEKSINHCLLIIDLALPRDVEPSVRSMKNVNLFCLEDLDTVIENNKKVKAREAERIRDIIDVEVEKSWKEIIKSEREPVLWR